MTTAAPPIPEEAAQALRVRAALEPVLMRETAPDALLEAIETRGADTWALHRRLAELSPNPVLRGVYLTLLDIAEAQPHAER